MGLEFSVHIVIVSEVPRPPGQDVNVEVRNALTSQRAV